MTSDEFAILSYVTRCVTRPDVGRVRFRHHSLGAEPRAESVQCCLFSRLKLPWTSCVRQVNHKLIFRI